MRHGITPAMALLAALGIGAFGGGTATTAQAERAAQEARQDTGAKQDRTRAPVGPGGVEQALRFAYGGYGRGPAGGYRKRPHGTHKQNARVEARRLRGSR